MKQLILAILLIGVIPLGACAIEPSLSAEDLQYKQEQDKLIELQAKIPFLIQETTDEISELKYKRNAMSIDWYEKEMGLDLVGVFSMKLELAKQGQKFEEPFELQQTLRQIDEEIALKEKSIKEMQAFDEELFNFLDIRIRHDTSKQE